MRLSLVAVVSPGPHAGALAASKGKRKRPIPCFHPEPVTALRRGFNGRQQPVQIDPILEARRCPRAIVEICGHPRINTGNIAGHNCLRITRTEGVRHRQGPHGFLVTAAPFEGKLHQLRFLRFAPSLGYPHPFR